MRSFLRNPVTWFLLFIPVAVVLDRSHASAPLIFFSAALAIIPIAVLIVHATEQIAIRTGDAIGGLLNATFGNAPELIISIVALKAGYFAMVRASLVGAILANLLLALGVAMLLGGLRYHDQKFNPTATRAYSTMMFIAAVSMAVPSAFSRNFPHTAGQQVETLNIGIAVMLLVAYGLYLVFSLRTHPEAFESVEDAHASHAEEEKWPVPVAVVCLIGASVLAAWMSEILVGAAEETGKALGMTEFFIGIVFLAILGGAAESASAIAVARKNKMDMTVSIALGSCIQIALFVAPVLVISSYFIAPSPLALSFNRAEIGALGTAVILGTLVCADGHSNWYRGVQLLTLYAIIALMFYLIPVLG